MAKSRFREGASFRTNDAFTALFAKSKKTMEWTGTLVRPHAGIAGAWHVNITEPTGLRVQVFHEKFMEIIDG